MSVKSEWKRARKLEMQATHGFSSAWQQFKNQPVEDRTAQRAEAQQELAAAIQTVIRHGSPVFTVRKEGR
jgi:hypothetical protein